MTPGGTIEANFYQKSFVEDVPTMSALETLFALGTFRESCILLNITCITVS